MTRTRKAKATQAQKLRNSAKGKVPKSALGELGKGQNALLPGAGGGALEELALESGLHVLPRRF